MKIAQFSGNNGVVWGEIDGENFTKLNLHIFNDDILIERTKERLSVSQYTRGLPFMPKRILGVGDNFPRSTSDKKIPTIFMKSIKGLTTNNSSVKIPGSLQVWPEPEIGLVIKKNCVNLSESNFLEHIFGYILVNDITACDPLVPGDTHGERSKDHEHFCPLADHIETNFNFQTAEIIGQLSGVPYRQGHVGDLKWDLYTLLKNVNDRCSLMPFDLVMTGTPARILNEKTFVKSGDVFKCSVLGLGELTTYFK